ncbi:nuclear transport factor 2 family protein [Streptomyces sp. RKND-216]|uniref:nuclear transport factor 2 family protein n=1 Tax=Streptomyces sp. RKND-216 TaxID=2562581 RepID=UPI00109E06BD|nr:nuclear transport factor 2 family protein [Streptomyces sp. RKND-216]THA25418.1 nuclear transport factor 2 family protein [Streptomyces sp. RKND-216]
MIIADTEEARRDAGLVLEFFGTVLSGEKDTGAVPRFLAEDFVDHDADGPRQAGGRQQAGRPVGGPAAGVRPLQVIAAAGHVVVRFLLECPGAPSVPFSDTYRLADGRITEHWHVVGSTG